MRLLPADERGLRRALELASDASAFASPNPTVGCVLARPESSTVLGEGAHFYDNFDHAEIVALKQARAAGHDLHGATACVTLEPCVHHGRTGPCSDALIAAGITRCVVATFDPNPVVRGNGLARLSAAGVEVLVLPADSELAQQARRLNDAFAFAIQHQRPFVTLKAAVSVDGKLAPPPGERSATAPHWLTGSAARADVQRLRHASDAILTGVGTVLADDPELTDRTGLPRMSRPSIPRRLYSAAAGIATGASCGSTTERSGSSQNAHMAAPATRRTADTINGAPQFWYCAKTPKTKGDSAPPKLPAMFIIPDTVPEYLPPQSMGTAQEGPIVHSRKNMAAVRE